MEDPSRQQRPETDISEMREYSNNSCEHPKWLSTVPVN